LGGFFRDGVPLREDTEEDAGRHAHVAAEEDKGVIQDVGLSPLIFAPRGQGGRGGGEGGEGGEEGQKGGGGGGGAGGLASRVAVEICTMVRDEERDIEEFVEYHILLGVAHVHVYLHLSAGGPIYF
jgi:hypothetical protein